MQPVEQILAIPTHNTIAMNFSTEFPHQYNRNGQRSNDLALMHSLDAAALDIFSRLMAGHDQLRTKMQFLRLSGPHSTLLLFRLVSNRFQLFDQPASTYSLEVHAVPHINKAPFLQMHFVALRPKQDSPDLVIYPTQLTRNLIYIDEESVLKDHRGNYTTYVVQANIDHTRIANEFLRHIKAVGYLDDLANNLPTTK